MRFTISLLGVLSLAACTHVAVSPLRDSKGTPVVIRIPGVPVGRTPRPVDVMAINTRMLAGRDQDEMLYRYLPETKPEGQAASKLDGMTGEVQTFRGETFHAYFPILKVAAVSSEARVQSAANQMAADLYVQAKKSCLVYPMTDLKVRH